MVIQPTVEWINNSTSTDPSGHRHEHNSSFGFVKVVNTSPNGQLDYGAINTTVSGNLSNTKLVYFRAVSMGDASGIFNMRFFLKNSSSFDRGNYRFIERKTFDFVPNLRLSEADSNTPTSVPTQANYKSTRQFPDFQFGNNVISGILDRDVGQYIYLSIFADVDVPVGLKGGGGAGSLRYRLLYDYS